MSEPNPAAGFTLIETLIYIAFFGLLMGSLLGITYQTIQSSDQISKKIVVQQEANFLLRKIDWVLTGASSVGPAGTGRDLAVARYAAPQSVELKSGGSYLAINVNDGRGFLNLNSQNALLSNLTFAVSQAAGQPQKIQTDFDLTCANCAASQLEHFEEVRYLRQ